MVPWSEETRREKYKLIVGPTGWIRKVWWVYMGIVGIHNITFIYYKKMYLG